MNLAQPTRWVWPLLAALAALPTGRSLSQVAEPADERRSTVGEPRTIEGLFLPGSLLEPRPLNDDRQLVVIRIINAFPQGTLGFRYDLTYTGYEPGDLDLRDYLRRADGAPADDLPAIAVHVDSLLPPGQVQPNALPDSGIPVLGGYRFWMAVGAILWIWVFAALILLGWKKNRAAEEPHPDATLADLLRPRIQAAMDNQLDARQYAELERMLIAMWQRKLGLGDVDPSAVVGQIRRHPEAGPLMSQLERWMHDPSRDTSVDLAKLLEPLGRIPARELREIRPAPTTELGSPADRRLEARIR
jgi:hypothetical protein